MANKVLDEIKKIEDEADNYVAKAQSEGKNIIKTASAQSDSEVSDAREKAKAAYSEIYNAKKRQAEGEAGRILEDERKKISAIENLDSEKVRRAVKLIVERIVKPDGSC